MNDKTRRTKVRRIILLVIALITIPGAYAYIELVLARPIGEGPAGPAVDAADFKDVWTDRAVKVLGIGDSVTAGLGAKSPSHTFFNRILKNPADEFPAMQGVCLSAVLPNLDHENHAISGSESDLHLEIIREEIPVEEQAYGIVLMTSGGNDLIHSYGRSAPRQCAMYGATLKQAAPWIDNFKIRLRTMFEEIDQKFPVGCEIYIGDIYDPTDGVGDAPSIFLPDWPDGLAIHARYNETIRSVAAERNNVFVVPLHATFLGHGSHCRQFWRSTYDREDPHYWFYSNIEDPNDRGYDAIRRTFLNTIVQHSRLKPRE
ncbi:SGNH/GDSL hydrolase family protein [Roseiconus lacunae]|uniref:SGNH/GDSL hydrolase family protein n=1 Tax=Roseiconus lacunae TaxID=2605694 RepID=UPI001E2DC8FB|nr:SGNH/GDSL hydrolase family protein [Roseiconus lacunae]MCD0461192.1 SGNH/GDSL hydrolase family protein [Roseiconus lacunae]WRQ51650.1 SGNH/GDSL hydrolase family protein [Stieleria sp. HD01]